VLYDAWLTKGASERQVAPEHDSQLNEGDAFTYENEVYSVTRVDPGHHEFVAVIAADWKGEVGQGRFVAP